MLLVRDSYLCVCEALETFEALFLLLGSVQRLRTLLEKREQIGQPTHAIDAVAKDQRPAAVHAQEVVQVRVFFVLKTSACLSISRASPRHSDVTFIMTSHS